MSQTKNVLLVSKAALLTVTCVLFSCGGGGSSGSSQSPTPTPTPAPAPAPAPIPSPDLTQDKLLSDDELKTPALSIEPAAPEQYVSWLEQNHHPIRSVTYDQDFSDLEFLAPLLEGKRLVQLGESSHGTKEFNHLKVRMIKYMHQQLGYSVVAFESGFFEGAVVNDDMENLSATQMMRFLFGVWHSNEVRELFAYVKSTQNTANPLQIAGFDVQISNQSFYNRITGYIDSSDIDTALKQQLVSLFGRYTTLYGNFISVPCINAQTNTNCSSIVSSIRALRNEILDDIIPKLELLDKSNTKNIVMLMAVESAAQQIQSFYSDYIGSRTAGFNDRDLGMAKNVSRLMNDVYPNEKIIVWAHNGHINHNQSDKKYSDGRLVGEFPMGQTLYNEFASELYTIGFYMLRGTTASSLDNSSLPVVALANNSLEAISYKLRKAAVFFDTSPEQIREAGNEFLFEPTLVHIWGGSFGQYLLVPSDNYNGVIVIDESTMPDFS